MKLDIFQLIDMAREKLGDHAEVLIRYHAGAYIVRVLVYEYGEYHSGEFRLTKEQCRSTVADILGIEFRHAVEAVSRLVEKAKEEDDACGH